MKEKRFLFPLLIVMLQWESLATPYFLSKIGNVQSHTTEFNDIILLTAFDNNNSTDSTDEDPEEVPPKITG
ncbi:MAG: hypothetical protein D6680_22770 [Cyanobacteria bacterium J007]|nr:MAG: hypothetical protein D6680_22770 [Cyanobacteria bacterium J007]